MDSLKKRLKNIPLIGVFATYVYRNVVRPKAIPFPGTEEYWEERYAGGGNSGCGSGGKLAEFKAEVINLFVDEHGIQTVIEFGCGDGNHISLANYPTYLGLDVSATAISLCREKFASDKSKAFKLMREYEGEEAELALSLDVIYHLVEDDLFEKYMHSLFSAAEVYVLIYSSDTDDNKGFEGSYVKHRKFTGWVSENVRGWDLTLHIPNRYPYQGNWREESFADFFIYEKTRVDGDSDI